MNVKNNHTQFIEECSKNLIDLTNRNKLINFNFNAKTLVRHFIEVAINDDNDDDCVLEITARKSIPHENKNDEMVINNGLDSSGDVFKSGDYTNDTLYKRFKKNYNKQEELKKEKGFNSTFFVYGFFKYKDNSIERHAPIFLINCDIQLVNKIYYKCVIKKDFENCVFNYAIEEYFSKEFDIKIPTDITSNIDSFSFESIKDRILKLKEFLTKHQLDHESDAITIITIENRFVISSYFNSVKQSLYLEMQQHSDKITNHPMINFLLSDTDASQTLNQDEYGNFEKAESIDKNYKSDYFCNVFDCDGSQLEVIKAAKDGKSFVIQGPPGTGKTQTISNIIAELVFSGKKVLFVAEKKAAIDAVLKKFNEVGLDKIFLDLHNKNISSKNIVSQITESYGFFEKYFDKSKVTFDFTRLKELKDNIINRSDTLHKFLPIGKTTFDLISSICTLEKHELQKVKCEIKINTKDEYDKALSLLRKTTEYSQCYLGQNPWLNINFNILPINIEDAEVIKSALRTIEKLCSDNSKIKQRINDISIGIDSSHDLLSKESHVHFNVLSLNIEDAEVIKSALRTIEKLCSDNSKIKQRINDISIGIQDAKTQLSFKYQFNIDTCEKTISLMNSLKNYLPVANDINNPWLSVEFENNINIDNLQDIDKLISSILVYLKDLEAILNERIAISSSNFIKRVANILTLKDLGRESEKKIFNIVECKKSLSCYFDLDIKIKFNTSNLAMSRDDAIQIRKELEIKRSNIQKIIDVSAYKKLLKTLEQFSLTNCWLKIKSNENDVLELIDYMQNHYRLKQDLKNLQEKESENNLVTEVNFKTLERFFNIAALKKDVNNNDISYLQSLINNKINVLIDSLNTKYNLHAEFTEQEAQERNNKSKIEEQFAIMERFFNIAALKKDVNNNDISYLQSLINKADDIIQTVDYLNAIKNLESAGVGSFWNEIITKKISKNEIEKTFEKALYSQILDTTLKQHYKLKNTESIKDDISDFKILDKDSIQANIDKFKYKFASKICNKIYQELKISKLLGKQRFPKPRKLISDYRSEIISISGCVVCSPLTICQYFDIEESNTEIFDTVIFDEASQICTWDAVSSIIRAKQLIVAGDREQMPPSNYFTSLSTLEDEEDENIIDDRVGDYESLLDFLNTKLKSLPLVWHYRSKYEQLIAPSNKNVYENKLITFPSSNMSNNPMEFYFVKNAIWDRGKNEIEAKQVLNKLRELYKCGKRSVGVIAINCKQSEFIQELIETDEDLLRWYREEDGNGLFVKNLENCQGDERDIIIISLTFAKDKNMKLSGTTFRQINSDDSYKKLNVMFTRAREKVYLFSSINSQDVPAKDSKAYSFLCEYMKCCETGSIDVLKQNSNYDNFDSGFEENVCHLLRSQGFEVHSQVGCSGYKIDLAILCPINKDRYLLGIECDGEQYHKGRTAREKDRLRQELLENKGWKIHRIWSYDWLADKNLEVEKMKKLIYNT